MKKYKVGNKIISDYTNKYGVTFHAQTWKILKIEEETEHKIVLKCSLINGEVRYLTRSKLE